MSRVSEVAEKSKVGMMICGKDLTVTPAAYMLCAISK